MLALPFFRRDPPALRGQRVYLRTPMTSDYLEWAHLRGESYALPEVRDDYGGLLVTLARQEHPDMSAYNAPEVVWKADKPFHAAMIVVSPQYERVEALLDDYTVRVVQDFSTAAAPMDATRTGHSG